MVNNGCFKIAVVDFDDTLVEGTLASRIVKEALKRKDLVPRSYLLKALKYSYLPLLTKLKRFYRVYRHLLWRSYKLYIDTVTEKKIDKNKFFSLVRDVVNNLDIPEESMDFLRRLKEKGYYVVLVTAMPQEIADIVREKIGVDEAIGSRNGRVLDREGKEEVVKELKKRGCVEIIVGNPGNEPFWLAEKLAIMVRSPKDLRRWVLRI